MNQCFSNLRSICDSSILDDKLYCSYIVSRLNASFDIELERLRIIQPLKTIKNHPEEIVQGGKIKN